MSTIPLLQGLEVDVEGHQFLVTRVQLDVLIQGGLGQHCVVQQPMPALQQAHRPMQLSYYLLGSALHTVLGCPIPIAAAHLHALTMQTPGTYRNICLTLVCLRAIE